MDPDGLDGLALVEAAVRDVAAAAPLPCLGEAGREQQQQQLKEEAAKVLQVQKQEVDLAALEEHLLTHNMVDMGRSSSSSSTSTVISTSVSSLLGNIPLPDLFPQNIKQEAPLRLTQEELEGYANGVSGGVSGALVEDSGIWQDLDLPPTLPDISDFELVSEVEHLDNILHQSGDGAAAAALLLKETKPPPVGNGGTANTVNGTGAAHKQQQTLHPQLHPQLPAGSLLSSVTIKEERETDDFLLCGATQVVKQEKTDASSFCQPLCLHQGAGAAATTPAAEAAVAPYRYNSLQKPFSLVESWSSSRFGESNLGTSFSLTR